MSATTNNTNPKAQNVLRIRELWGRQIREASQKYNISPALLGAFGSKESLNGDKYSTRFEAHYKTAIIRTNKARPSDILPGSHSHGACQIMGVHAKAFAYLGTLKTEQGYNLIHCGTLDLTIDDLYNIPFDCCCKVLKYNCEPYLSKKDYANVGSIYNGGVPSSNIPSVKQYVKELLEYITLYEISYKNVSIDQD